MFRFAGSPESQAWGDVICNIGKLSLAGLFVSGGMWFSQAYADSPIMRPFPGQGCKVLPLGLDDLFEERSGRRAAIEVVNRVNCRFLTVKSSL